VLLRERVAKRVSSPIFKISVAYVFIHALMIIVLDKVTAFAPDENNYLAIFSGVVKGELVFDGFAGWSKNNQLFLELIYFPATIFSMFGLTDLQSIRILSSLATYLSLLMLYSLAGETRVMGMSHKNWVVLGFFFPTIILWSSLGLRESFIFLWITCIFYFLKKYLDSNRLIHGVALLASSASLALTKNYLYAILAIALIISTFLLVLATKSFHISLLIILSLVLAPIIALPEVRNSLISGAKFVTEQKIVQQPVGDSSKIPTPTEVNPNSESSTKVNRGETLSNVLDQANVNPTFFWVVQNTGIYQKLKNQAEDSSSVTPSKDSYILVNKLSITPASLRDPMSLLQGIVGFVIKPLPFLDNGSPFLNILSYESIFWYPIYGLLITILYRSIKGHNKWNLSSATASLFILGFLIQSALTEINVGTAYRHRSILLMGIIILCVVFNSNPFSSRRVNVVK